MSFFLVKLEADGSGNLVDVPLPDFGPYETGSEAAKHAKNLTSLLGHKVQPRRINQAGDWRQRQNARFADGTLKPLPATWDLEPIKDHFAHLAKDPTKIAFTENEELGAIDRVTVLSPGRYLSRFYPDVDDAHRRTLIALIDPCGEIHFARTREEIARVYKTGPESCMDGEHDFDELPCWPTEPYAGGDLAVAYTVNNRGRIQARAVCWPDKKQFGRVYGDVQRLKAALLSEGFEEIRSCGKRFDGARLLKIPVNNGDECNEFVMPYFDDIEWIVDMGDHFITSSAKPAPDKLVSKGGGTGGYMTLMKWCPKLEDFYSVSDFTFIHGVNQEWGPTARHRHAFMCQATKTFWPLTERVTMYHGEYWSKQYFAEHGEVCSHTGWNCRKEDMVSVMGRRVHRDYATLAMTPINSTNNTFMAVTF